MCEPGISTAIRFHGVRPHIRVEAGDGFGATMGTVLEATFMWRRERCRTLYRMIMLGNRKWFRAFLHSSHRRRGDDHRRQGGELREDGRYYTANSTKEDYRKLARGEEVARQLISTAARIFLR